MTFEFQKKIYGYECDIYGHLNNANYLQILEAARSEALIDMQLPVAKLLEMGIQIFVIHYELDYLKAVELDAKITVKSYISKMNRLRSVWQQDIYNSDGELCFKSTLEAVFAKGGKAARIDVNMYEHFLKYC